MQEASAQLRQMARFGALVAQSACTLDELSAGLRISQGALGAMLRLSADGGLHGVEATEKEIRDAHRSLGHYAGTLQKVRAALGQRPRLDELAKLAVSAGPSIWRYEALKGLRGVAWSGVGTPRGQRAEALLEGVAEASDVPKDAKRSALESLTKLRASR